jgi:predicted nucleic acid-binding Zn finger protein
LKLLKHISSDEGEELFLVQGESAVYVVKLIGSVYSCSCPSFMYHKGDCKHIVFVKRGCLAADKGS